MSNGWEFAVLDGKGNVTDVLPNAEDAAHVAGVTRENPYYPVDPGKIMEMDELTHLTQVPSTGRMAFQWSSLEQVSGHEVLELTDGLTDASRVFERLRPFFKHLKGQNWADPDEMIADILSTNAKVSKPHLGIKGTILGLTLVPFWRNTQAELVRDTRATPELLQQVENDFDVASDEKPPKEDNWCMGSSWACRRACLIGTGMNYQTGSFKTKFAKAHALKQDPVAFLSALAMSVALFSTKEARAGRQAFVRLNMLSDIPWEIVFPDLFTMFPDVTFYDYTKVNVAKRKIPKNYDLTFSFNGINDDACRAALEAGHRIAVVFVSADPTRKAGPQGWKQSVKERKTLPRSQWTMKGKKTRVDYEEIVESFGEILTNPFKARVGAVPLVDGDVTDYRAADPAPSVVALSYKQPRYNRVLTEEVETYIKHESRFAMHVVPVRRIGDALVTPHTPWQTPLTPEE